MINIRKCKKSIKSSTYNYKTKKVFNFEVADWHTYFVGLLVHNARPCLEMISKMPKWLQKIMKGNYFNYIREQYYKRIGGFSEIVLSNGKRLDSYIPGKEIISRKFSQLADITTDTAKKYIDEITKKYKPGTEIKNTKRNVDVINKGGNTIEGNKVLEIPVQKNNVPKEVLDHATDNRVIIKDTKGTVYNPEVLDLL